MSGPQYLLLLLAWSGSFQHGLNMVEINVGTVCKIYGSYNTTSLDRSSYNATACGSHVFPEYTMLCEIFDFAIARENEKLNEYGIHLNNIPISYCNDNMEGYAKGLALLNSTANMCQSLEESLEQDKTKNISAIFGTFDSGLAEMYAVSFGQKCVPIFPILASAQELDILRNFVRSIPSDKYQVEVVLKLLHTLGIYYVTVMYDKSYYGTGLFYEFQEALTDPKKNPGHVCLDVAIQLPFDVSDVDPHTLQVLLSNVIVVNGTTHSHIIILFLNEDIMKQFFSALHTLNFTQWTDNFLVITSDNTYRENFGDYSYSENIITIQPTINHSHYYNASKFWRYLSGISLEDALRDNKSNLAQLIGQDHNCTFNKDRVSRAKTHNRCVGNETLRVVRAQHPITEIATAFVIRTFDRFAEALQHLMNKSYSQSGKACRNFTGDDVTGYTRDVAGYNEPDYALSYDIMKFEHSDRDYDLVKVGYTEGTLGDQSLYLGDLNLSSILENAKEIQQNHCHRDACDANGSMFRYNLNCHTCVPCGSIYEYVNQNSTCHLCPKNTIPTRHGNSCTTENAVSSGILSSDGSPTPSGIAIIAFCSIGFLVSFISLIIVIKDRGTPIMRVAKPEVLIVMILTGLLNFAIAIRGATASLNNFQCEIMWYGFTISMVIGTTCLLAKLYLYASISSLTRIRGDTPTRSVTLSFIFTLSCLQLVVIVLVRSMWPPFMQPYQHETVPGYSRDCSWFNDPKVQISLLSYPLILMVIMTICALRLINFQLIFFKRQIIVMFACGMSCTIMLIALISVMMQGNSKPQQHMLVLIATMIVLGYIKLMFHVVPMAILTTCRPKLNTHSYVSEQYSDKISIIGQVAYRISIDRIDHAATPSAKSNVFDIRKW